MTLSKVQGQIFESVGIYPKSPVLCDNIAAAVILNGTEHV